MFATSLTDCPAPAPATSRRLGSRDYLSLVSDLLPPWDFVCLILAGYVSTLVYASLFPLALLVPQAGIQRGSLALIGALLAPFLLYDRNFAASMVRAQAGLVVRSFSFRFLLIVAVALAIGSTTRVFEQLPPAWVAIWLAASLCLTALGRLLAARWLAILQHRGCLRESIAVIGAGAAADRFNEHLRETRDSRVELLGIFDDLARESTVSSQWPAGTIDELIALSRVRSIDWVLVTNPTMDEEHLQSVVRRLQGMSVAIALCPQDIALRLSGEPIQYAGNGMPVVLLADRPIKRLNAVLKTLEDFVLGSVLTLLLLPVLALIALAIRLDSPGPALYRQRRHAFNNGEFEIYKFRTMRWAPAGAEAGLRQTSRGDERITRIGRFLRASSLDELPQLFNVLQGHMSLVGPRPHAVNMRTEDRLGAEITDLYAHRHRVKPGMTGWSQVNGSRGATTTRVQLERRVALDLHYIDHWSLGLDFLILVLTCREVLRRTDAY